MFVKVNISHLDQTMTEKKCHFEGYKNAVYAVSFVIAFHTSETPKVKLQFITLILKRQPESRTTFG